MKTHAILLSFVPLLFLSCKGKQEQNNPASLVGVYSNQAEGFQTVTVTLGRNGAGFLSGAVASAPVRTWNYSEKDKTISIEGLFGDGNTSDTMLFVYDPSAKTLKGKGKGFNGTLNLLSDKRSLSFLNRWDKVADKGALDAARDYAQANVAFDKEKLIITTMNTVDPVIKKNLVDRGFSLESNDECFAIIGYSKGQMNHRTIQLRIENSAWKVVQEK
ncbi:MAG: hypothetical protein HN759_02120 [Akkermansiaceae bacterium]|jgi:hypothetical protein|nr:hypothetical protein [Akkermansiaceae bacterium]